MKRLLAFASLLLVACLISGIYGAVHNQVSYTVSHEYFTKFKFQQFQISPHLHDRWGAALVGWQASWWMGLIIGCFLIPAGLLLRHDRAFVIAVLRSFGVVLGTAALIGSAALLISTFTVVPRWDGAWIFRGQVILDDAPFRRVAVMHNFSYVGGLIGIFTGFASIVRAFLAENAASHDTSPESRIE
ncbi:MAG: hypothetical protein AAGD07_18025 [Planctomycetota bacterium]